MLLQQQLLRPPAPAAAQTLTARAPRPPAAALRHATSPSAVCSSSSSSVSSRSEQQRRSECRSCSGRAQATKRGSTLARAGPAAGDAVYQDKEKHIHDNVAALKKEAKEYHAQLIQQVEAAASLKTTATSADGKPISYNIRQKLLGAIAALQEGLVERESEVRLLLLAAMSREHILLIGPPGTAKSEVGRRLNKLVSGTYFERLLTRFSVPEELFGPLSMRALEEDKYVRQTRGYLPEAEVCFIDEIFKANSAILNTLLTVINERLFDNGSQRVPVPLLTMVGASNELPESEELDALYDRFLIRKQVKQVSAAGLGQMLTYYSSNDDGRASNTLDAVASDMMVTRADIEMCKEQALKTVKVPANVVQMVTDLRTYLQDKMEPPVYVSDRRLVKSVQLLQVAAFCNGRDMVTEYDVLLLQHVLWQKPDTADKIADWVLSHLSADDGTKQVNYLLTGLFSRSCRSLGNKEKLEELKAEAASLRGVLLTRYQAAAVSLEGDLPVVLDNLWLGEDEAQAVATSLQPKLTKTRMAINSILTDLATLEVALRNGSDPVTLANLLPRHWADFIRNADVSEVRPIGTTPARTP